MDEEKRCARCSKVFPKKELIYVGDKWYCTACLKEIAREARGTGRGGKRAGVQVIIAALISALLGVIFIFENYTIATSFINSLKLMSIFQVMGVNDWLNLALFLFWVGGCYAIAYGLLTFSRWTYYAGLLFNTLLIAYSCWVFIGGVNPDPALLIIRLVGGIAVILVLLKNKTSLTPA